MKTTGTFACGRCQKRCPVGTGTRKPAAGFPAIPILLGMLCSVSLLAQTATQSFTLNPGWNAVYLEVEPENVEPSVVFSNVPVSSVWTWADRLTSVSFIQDPSEANFNRAGWLGWYPPGRPEAFLSNLHSVQAHRAYLIRLNSATPITWNVSGRVILRRPGWAPDSYTLRGFSLDQAQPPRFLDFFRAAKAHYNETQGVMEKIYRLNALGQWALVGPGESMKRGEAYWVYSRGASDYEAPVEVRLQYGTTVDFAPGVEDFAVEIRNRTTAAKTVVVRIKTATEPAALAYRVFQAVNGGYLWPDLPASHSISVAEGESYTLRLAIRRGRLSVETYSAVLEVADDEGTSHLIPVTASKPMSAALRKGAHPLQGLWLGTVSVNAVNEVNSPDSGQLTPVPAPFPLRLLLHVDMQGQTRFLKEIIQMWRDGTYTNDSSGHKVVDRSGEYVLLTDDRLIGQFKGSTLRDGVAVGRRISTAGFDFDGGSDNSLKMNGEFEVGGVLSLTMVLDPNFPTNPFRHKYHPDHDNLDGRFVALTNNFEAYTVSREIQLEFTENDPVGASSPDYGYSVMAGIYREVLTGLHKEPIRLQGNFKLTRAVYSGELNPSP